ncbi:MAG: hypothetical protein ACTSV5_01975 [Promethearchaeota archaeon]
MNQKIKLNDMTLVKAALNDDQLEKLIKYLKQIKYSKINLVEDILDSTVNVFPDRETFEISEESLEDLIRELNRHYDINWIISLLSSHVHEQYEKTISQGQVQAILKRILGIALTSTERSQLHELRKKVQRYEKFINNFGVWGKKYDFPLKIIMFGLNKNHPADMFYLLNKRQVVDHNTIGVDFYTYDIEAYDKSIVQVQLWHMSNDERFAFLRKQYMRGVTGVVLFFDKSNRESYEDVEKFILELKEQTNFKVSSRKLKKQQIKMPIALVGIDKPTLESDLIPMDEIHSLTKEIGAKYSEISSKNDYNLSEILRELSYEFITRFKEKYKVVKYRESYKQNKIK